MKKLRFFLEKTKGFKATIKSFVSVGLILGDFLISFDLGIEMFKF